MDHPQSGCPSKPQNNLTRPLTFSFATIFILTLIYFVFKSIFDCIMKHTTANTNQTSATISDSVPTTTTATELTSEPGKPCCQQHFDLDIIIPVITYDVQPSSLPSEKHGSDDERCSICLGEFCYGNTVRVLPRCRHMFHKDCIDDWLPFRSSFCPVCRARAIEVHDEPPRTTCTHDGNTSPPLILNFGTNHVNSFL